MTNSVELLQQEGKEMPKVTTGAALKQPAFPLHNVVTNAIFQGSSGYRGM